MKRSDNIFQGKTPKVKKSKARAKKVKAKAAPAKKLRNLKELYSFKRAKENDPQSRKIFDKKPSDMDAEDIRRLVKGVNDRLYKLEQAGLEDSSATYQNILEYANSGSNYYNLNLDTGTVRMTQDMSRFKTDQEKYDYIRRMQEILSNKTSTVGGTNKALKKMYDSFMKNPQLMKKGSDGKMHPIDLTFEEYKNIWKAYKDNVVPDKEGRYESQTVIDFIHATREVGFYDIPSDMLGEAFRYYEQNKENYEDMYSYIIDNPGVFGDL